MSELIPVRFIFSDKALARLDENASELGLPDAQSYIRNSIRFCNWAAKRYANQEPIYFSKDGATIHSECRLATVFADQPRKPQTTTLGTSHGEIMEIMLSTIEYSTLAEAQDLLKIYDVPTLLRLGLWAYEWFCDCRVNGLKWLVKDGEQLVEPSFGEVRALG